jgi:hypothetical protein
MVSDRRSSVIEPRWFPCLTLEKDSPRFRGPQAPAQEIVGERDSQRRHKRHGCDARNKRRIRVQGEDRPTRRITAKGGSKFIDYDE